MYNTDPGFSPRGTDWVFRLVPVRSLTHCYTPVQSTNKQRSLNSTNTSTTHTPTLNIPISVTHRHKRAHVRCSCLQPITSLRLASPWSTVCVVPWLVTSVNSQIYAQFQAGSHLYRTAVHSKVATGLCSWFVTSINKNNLIFFYSLVVCLKTLCVIEKKNTQNRTVGCQDANQLYRSHLGKIHVSYRHVTAQNKITLNMTDDHSLGFEPKRHHRTRKYSSVATTDRSFIRLQTT